MSQVKLLKDLFKQALGEEGAVRVDINTIDGFQVCFTVLTHIFTLSTYAATCHPPLLCVLHAA